MPTRLLLVALATLSLIACDPPLSDGDPLADGGVIGATADEIGDPHDWPGGRYAVRYPNALGDSITGVLALPPGNARVPAVMVLHGSGGLFRPDDAPDFDPATAELERQFREWEALLAEDGYAAFFPASFYSRGYFDWNEDRPDGLDAADRLWMRAYDAVAGLAWLCGHPRVDCGRTAVIGFSNGGSTLLMSEYTGLTRHAAFAGIDGLWPAQPPRTGIAFYPGCGLDGFVAIGEGDYRPAVPMLVLHGARDRLLEHCEARQQQAEARGGAFELRVYDGVEHSFDGYPENAVERAARDDARALTRARLRAAFGR